MMPSLSDKSRGAASAGRPKPRVEARVAASIALLSDAWCFFSVAVLKSVGWSEVQVRWHHEGHLRGVLQWHLPSEAVVYFLLCELLTSSSLGTYTSTVSV